MYNTFYLIHEISVIIHRLPFQVHHTEETIPGIFQSILIWVQGPAGLGNMRHLKFGNFNYCHQLRNSCSTWIYIVSYCALL